MKIKMQTKKSQMQILIILGVILLIGLIAGGIYLFLKFPSSQAIIQTGTYTCPIGDYCSVTPILECTNPITDAKVILRTNTAGWNEEDFDITGAMIALDTNGDGALEGYIKTTTQTNCVKGGSSTNLFKDKNIGIDFIYLYNSKVYVCVSDSKSFRYESTTLIPTSISPLEPYKSNNQEKYQGSLYSCSRDLKKNNVLIGTISHSGSSPTPSGGKIGSTYSLVGGDTFKAEGTGIIKLDAVSSQVPITTCISSDGTQLQIGETICKDQYVLEICESIGEHPTLTKQDAIPPKICRDGAIIDAYSVQIDLSKLVLSRTEKLKVDFALKDTPDNKNIEITASIYKGSQFITEKKQLTGSTYFTAGKTSFTFDTLPIGYYVLKLSFSHLDGDYSKEYNFQVTEDLAIVLTTVNPIQFDSKDIEASLQSFRSGSPKDLSNFELESVFNGKTIYQYTVEHPSLGILTFKFPLKGDGDLRLRARGNDEAGLWTDWTDYFEIKVNKATILFQTDFQTDKCVGSLTNKFETKDSLGNLVETQNQVTIDKPLGGTDSVSVSGKEGKYQFTYNFAEGGIYTVRITSSNAQLGSSQLNAGQGRIINILTGDACAGGGDCEGISCYTTYIIIGGIILAGVIFVYLVFFFRRK